MRHDSESDGRQHRQAETVRVRERPTFVTSLNASHENAACYTVKSYSKSVQIGQHEHGSTRFLCTLYLSSSSLPSVSWSKVAPAGGADGGCDKCIRCPNWQMREHIRSNNGSPSTTLQIALMLKIFLFSMLL